jgi:hypothetical protein
MPPRLSPEQVQHRTHLKADSELPPKDVADRTTQFVADRWRFEVLEGFPGFEAGGALPTPCWMQEASFWRTSRAAFQKLKGYEWIVPDQVYDSWPALFEALSQFVFANLNDPAPHAAYARDALRAEYFDCPVHGLNRFLKEDGSLRMFRLIVVGIPDVSAEQQRSAIDIPGCPGGFVENTAAVLRAEAAYWIQCRKCSKHVLTTDKRQAACVECGTVDTRDRSDYRRRTRRKNLEQRLRHRLVRLGLVSPNDTRSIVDRINNNRAFHARVERAARGPLYRDYLTALRHASKPKS